MKISFGQMKTLFDTHKAKIIIDEKTPSGRPAKEHFSGIRQIRSRRSTHVLAIKISRQKLQ